MRTCTSSFCSLYAISCWYLWKAYSFLKENGGRVDLQGSGWRGRPGRSGSRQNCGEYVIYVRAKNKTKWNKTKHGSLSFKPKTYHKFWISFNKTKIKSRISLLSTSFKIFSLYTKLVPGCSMDFKSLYDTDSQFVYKFVFYFVLLGIVFMLDKSTSIQSRSRPLPCDLNHV